MGVVRMSTFHEGADFDKFTKEYLTRVQNKQTQKIIVLEINCEKYFECTYLARVEVNNIL